MAQQTEENGINLPNGYYENEDENEDENENEDEDEVGGVKVNEVEDGGIKEYENENEDEVRVEVGD